MSRQNAFEAPHPADEEDITIERRVRLPLEAVRPPDSPTVRLAQIDEALLALARGEPGALEEIVVELDDPTVSFHDDPFGGLIPVDDEEGGSEHIDQLFEAMLREASG